MAGVMKSGVVGLVCGVDGKPVVQTFLEELQVASTASVVEAWTEVVILQGHKVIGRNEPIPALQTCLKKIFKDSGL